MSDEATVSITPSDLKDILRESVTAAIQEARRPDPEVEEQRRLAKERQIAAQKLSVARAKEQDMQRAATESACSHMKGHPYHGKTRIVAPLHSDGLHHPICLNCQRQFPPFPPGNDTIAPGHTLGDYDGVTAEVVEKWGKRYAERAR